jgi:putative ABC transport system substrate-binding protein
MGICLRRREFIAGLGGAVVTWPLAARGQQPAVSIVGYLDGSTPEANSDHTAGLLKGLSEIGYVEGRNLAIEYRFGRNDYRRLPELAADLINRKVNVIVSGAAGALAAMAVTKTVPIVFLTAGDPVQGGLVASLNRPGGNVTGVTSLGVEVTGKRIGLLHELLPAARH